VIYQALITDSRGEIPMRGLKRVEIIKIAILLAIAFLTIIRSPFGSWVFRPSSLSFASIPYLLGYAVYYFVITAGIYSIATFIKNNIIRNCFFIVIFIVTFLPIIGAGYIAIDWRINRAGDIMGAMAGYAMFIIPGALFNPPVIFAYVAHKIIHSGRFSRNAEGDNN
jgi:hypothetical protein